MKVVWSSRAIRHLVNLRAYIEKDSEQNAALVANRIDSRKLRLKWLQASRFNSGLIHIRAIECGNLLLSCIACLRSICNRLDERGGAVVAQSSKLREDAD